MLKNYLKIAWRSFSKNKVYALLNTGGLTIGMTCAIIIFLYVQYELTYDHHHANLENIYQLHSAYHLPNNGGREDYAVSGPLVGEVLGKDFPEIEQVVRLRKLSDLTAQGSLQDVRFYEELIVADSNLFNVFTFSFISGNPDKALLEPLSLVVSEDAAIKYFGTLDVLGKTLNFKGDNNQQLDLKITGVIKNPPANSQFKFNLISSMEGYRTAMGGQLTSWWNYSYYTYLSLKPFTDADALKEKIRLISRNYIAGQEDNSGYRQEYTLIPFSEVHLHSNLRNELEANGKSAYVYTFLIIGIFILVIACINFINIATARSAMRAKEIGLRKVVGAMRQQLIVQFLSEAFLITIISLVLAIGLSIGFLPLVNTLTGKNMELISNPDFWIILAGITFFVSVVSGSYPAVFLSGFKPAEILKGNFKSGAGSSLLRKSLVVFQFATSTFLIAGTLIAYNHLEYMRSIELGFDKEQVVIIPTRRGNASEYEKLKQELINDSDVTGASLSSGVPGKEMFNNVVRMGWDENAAWNDMRYITADFDFMNVFGLELAEGRGFNRDFPSDINTGFLLNESGVRRLGFSSPQQAMGQKLTWQSRQGQVIGVLKDFHFMSANVAVEPFIMVMNTQSSTGNLSIKLSKDDPREAVSRIEDAFKRIFPDKVFEYYFLDENFDRQYKAEDQFMSIFTFFTSVAIIIAGLGLYGLAMFMGELRLREVGIRKVLGATEQNVVWLFIKDHMKLIIISFVVAVPLSVWLMEQWLSSFPLREKISPLLLAGSCLIALVIALFTVSFQTLRAARSNPIDTITNK